MIHDTEGEQMAVTIKTKEDPFLILQKLEVSPNQIELLKQKHITLSLAPSKLTLMDALGGYLASVTVKAGVLTMAKVGSLGSASKAVLQKKVSDAVSQALNSAPPQGISDLGKASGLGDKLEAEGKAYGASSATQTAVNASMEVKGTQTGTMKGPAPTQQQSKPKWVGTDLAEGFKSPKVRLRDATTMYQPVYGTDSSSTYYCIGLSENLCVGVRVKDNFRISFRVEGSIAKYQNELAGAGLSVNSEHASVHMDCGDMIMAQKAIGALLLSLGVNLTTPIPQVKLLIGKGN